MIEIKITIDETPTGVKVHAGTPGEVDATQTEAAFADLVRIGVNNALKTAAADLKGSIISVDRSKFPCPNCGVQIYRPMTS
jgi:hypothetical protein